MDTGVRVSESLLPILQSLHLGGELVGHMVTPCPNFEKVLHCFPQVVAAPFYYPASNERVSTLVFNNNRISGCEVVSHSGFHFRNSDG